MKNTARLFPRWLAIFALSLSGAVLSQALDLGAALPSRQGVTQGRNVTLRAEFATGTVQWQFATKANPSTWTTLMDDSTYRGADTQSLEIRNVPNDLDGFSYRFIDNTAGVLTTSNAAKLVVMPLLFPQPAGIMLDGTDGLFVSDASTHTIRQITNALTYAWGNDVTCQTVVRAGWTGVSGSDDGVTGMPYGATFNQPNGIAGTAKAIVVADTANAMIRIISDQVTTLAGSDSRRGNTDGAGMQGRGLASFGAPIGVAQDAAGAVYVADSSNHTIRKVTADGVVSTLAGSPGNAGFSDGLGAAARFSNPTGIAVDASGTVYVGDTNNNLIRKITPAGMVTTLAGVAGVAGVQDGPGAQALFNGPTGLAVSDNGVQLFVADTGNSTIRLISPSTGNVTTYAGVPGVAGLQEGHGYDYFDMLLDHPRALVFAQSGVLFIADTGNAVIRAIPQYDGVTTTLPLGEIPAPVAVPPASFSPAVPVTPATPTTSQNAAASGAGGGACSEWFLGVLAGLCLLRKMTGGGRAAGNISSRC